MEEKQKLTLKPISKLKANLIAKSYRTQEIELSFTSYSESLRQLSQNFTFDEKRKLSNIFNLSDQQKHPQESLKSLFKDNDKIQNCRNTKRGKKKTKTQSPSHFFISEALDESDRSHSAQNHLSFQEINIDEQYLEDRQFTFEQRESLKNAFRYICRLIFKEAHKYSARMSKLFPLQKIQLGLHSQQKPIKKSKTSKSSILPASTTLSDLNLSEEAELISGERYFKQFIQRLSFQQRKILLHYMIWFLKSKYLRYINKCNNENKGKRKQMKKNLYIRFKNSIMLPYLEGLLTESTEQNLN